MCMFLFEETTASWFILHLFAFTPAQCTLSQHAIFGHFRGDLRVLELDLRFRGGLGLSPPLKFSSPIGLRPSPPLNLKTNSKVLKSYCKPSDFGFFCWSWAPKSIIGAGDLDAGGVLKEKCLWFWKMKLSQSHQLWLWDLTYSGDKGAKDNPETKLAHTGAPLIANP